MVTLVLFMLALCLCKIVIGHDTGTMDGGDPELGPHPASILYYLRKAAPDSPCLEHLEDWQYHDD